MAGRVNTKFVISLVTVLVLLAVGLGFVYMKFVNRSAAEYEAEGDTYAQRGELVRAVEAYGKAIGRDRDNLQLIEKYCDAASRMPVRTGVKAREVVGSIHSLKHDATKYYVNDQALLEDFYAMTLGLAREFEGPGAYDNLYELTSSRLQTQPGNPVAIKYRAIAEANRLRADLTSEQVQQVLDDLSAAQQAEPENAEVLFHIAMVKLFQASAAERRQPAQAKALRDEALEVSQAMLAVNPQDPDRVGKHLRVLLSPGLLDLEAARPIVDRLEQQLLENPQPLRRVILVSRVLASTDREPVQLEGGRTVLRGQTRAAALLTRASEADPNELAYHLLLVEQLKGMGQVDDALAVAEAALKVPTTGTAIRVLRASNVRPQLIFEEGNLALAKAAAASTEDKQAWLDRAQDAAKRLEELVRESAAVSHLKGKIAFLQGNNDLALQLLGQASDRYQDSNDEVLLLMSDAATKRGDWGYAAEQLRLVLARRPGATPLRLHLAELYIQHKQLDEAKRELAIVEQTDPGNPQLTQLQASVYASEGNFEKALAIYERYDLQQNPKLLKPLVEAYLASGRRDEAVALLRTQFDQQPGNVGLLQLLLRLVEDPQHQEQLIAQAREAGADPKVLDLFVSQLAGEQIDQQRVLDIVRGQTDDPLTEALTEAKLLAQMGKVQEAQAALDRAIQLKPDDPQIVTIRFELALSKNDLEEAERLAAQAGDLDLDLAQGAFFKARVAAARGRLNQAIDLARQGLTARPVFSEGWRLVGGFYQADRRYKEAIDAFSKALTHQPDDLDSMRMLSACQLANEQPQFALDTIRRAYRMAPNNPAVFAHYVATEQAVGDLNQAIRARQQRAELVPDDRDNRRALALLLARAGKAREAREVVAALGDSAGDQLANVAATAMIEREAGNPQAGKDLFKNYIDGLGDQARAADFSAYAGYLRSIEDYEDMVRAYHAGIAIEDPQLRQITREFGDVMFDLGRNDVARSMYEELHKQFPDDQTVALRLAETLIRLGDTEAAEQAMAGLDPSATTTLLEVIAQRQQGNDEQALALIDRALSGSRDLAPRDRAMLLLQRAELRFTKDRKHAGVVDDLRQALTLNPGLTQARLMLASAYMAGGAETDAIRELRAVLQTQPTNAIARQQLLQVYQARGDLGSARSLIDQAITLEPKQAQWHELSAQVAMRDNRLADAEAAWRRVIELQPNPMSINGLSLLLLSQQRADQALSLLDAHAQMVSAVPVLQAVRGRALAQTGRTDQALQVFTQAMAATRSADQMDAVVRQVLASYPDRKQALSVLSSMSHPTLEPVLQASIAQVELVDEQGAEAQSRLERILPSVSPDDKATRLVVLRTLGLAYYNNGLFDRAEKTYMQVIELEPDDLQTLNNMAYMLTEKLNRPKEALPMAERAYRLAPGNTAIADTYGWALYRVGQLDQAREVFEAINQASPIPPSHLHLALVLEAIAAGSSDAELQRIMLDRAAGQARDAIALAELTHDDDTQREAKALLERLTPKTQEVSP